MLKRRFPALKYDLRLKLSNTLRVIVATVVLHNIAVTLNEDEPSDDDKQLQQYVAEKRLQLLCDTDAVQAPAADIDAHTAAAAGNQQAATAVRKALIDMHFA